MASSLNTPDVLTQPIAENGDKNAIPATNDQSLGLMSQSTGFPQVCSERIADGGIAPTRADFNGAFNLLSRHVFFNQNGGVQTFRADVSTAIGGYPLGAILIYQNGSDLRFVRSLMANNTYNFVSTPSYIDDGSHWETLMPISKNISNWSSNVTNCITEIPQDINLTLSSGTLTLKAGSKIYAPDGTLYTVPSDLSISTPGNGSRFLFLRNDNHAITAFQTASCVSGTTDSLSGSGYHVWFDTANNVINAYTSDPSTPAYTCLLPFCIITGTTTEVSSIDQVFNGFGYIGSTVFALPGLSGLAAGGRNTDGTLKNQKRTVSNVSVVTSTATTADVYVAINNAGGISWSQPVARLVYKEPENFWYDTQAQIYNTSVYCARVKFASSRISEFYPATAFHAVDYSEYQSKDAQNVKLTGNQTVAGNKDFTGTVTAITQSSATDDSTKVATTAWVHDLLSYIGNNGGTSIESLITPPVAYGNITLLHPYTDYDGLLVVFCNDSETDAAVTFISTKELDLIRSYNRDWLLMDTQMYWKCTSASTTTTFVASAENCMIINIYGVKF